MGTLKLGVNDDHIATLRQARYVSTPDSKNVEPDPVMAASLCERAGASGITAHLRTDRRHVQERDLERLRANIMTKLNLEMGNTPELVDFALLLQPDEVCLVPEERHEITTEGGLDAVGQFDYLVPTVRRLQSAGVRVSLFIEPEEAQIDAAQRLKAEIVELHTGAFANAQGEEQMRELERLRRAALLAHDAGIRVNAGHGINYTNVLHLHRVPHLEDLNIGHSIICRSIFTGLERAVADMLAAMNPA